MGRGIGTGRGRLLLLGAVLTLALLTAALLGRDLPAPDWLVRRVEVRAEALLDGGSAGIGAMTLGLGLDGRSRVRLLDAELRDAAGGLLARVDEAAVTLSPWDLLGGRVLAEGLAIHGVEATVTRRPDGSLGGVLGGGGDGQGALRDRLELLFDRPAVAALRRVTLDGLRIGYEDERAGRAWTLDAAARLDLAADEVRITGEASLASDGGAATRGHIDYRGQRDGTEAEFGMTLSAVTPADVASQVPALDSLSLLDAPVSLAIRGRTDEAGRLGLLSVAVKVGEGRLSLPGGAPPLALDAARAYLSYDHDAKRLDLRRLEVRSGWGSVAARGQAWPRGWEGGLPGVMEAQVALDGATLSPPGWPGEPLRLSEAMADLRLRRDPFVLEVAQASALEAVPDGEEAARVLATGRAGVSPGGWSVTLDAQVAEASRERLLRLWPRGWRAPLRDWLAANLSAGTFTEASLAFRRTPGAGLRLAASTRMEGVTLRPLPTHPPIRNAVGRLSWDTGALSVALERGWIDAPEGGAVDVAGTALTMPAGWTDVPRARVDLQAAGAITAALSLLDVAPLSLMASAGLPVDLSAGSARARGTADVILGPMSPDDLRFDVLARLEGVSTDVLVPGRTLEADALEVRATQEGTAIEGPVRLEGIAATGRWSQRRDRPGASRVEAEVEVTPAALAELGIALPEGSVDGAGQGTFTLDLADGAAPRFAFSSSLEGLRLALPQMSWSKGPGARGSLEVSGRLGSPVTIDRMALSAPGLVAEGDLRLGADGSFSTLDLATLRVGGWFDAPVRLTSQGPNATPAIEVRGGEVDLVEAAFGTEGKGDGGPITIRLDRLQVTDAIALTALEADLTTTDGLEGTFRGLVNGAAAVTGRVAPSGGRVGVRVEGADAGAVMRAAGLFSRAEGGALDLLLLPVGEADYEGEAFIADLRVRDAPLLASLLNAVSVVGLLQQLGGQGIAFDEVAARFRIGPASVTVTEASATGASLGLSLSGTYDTVTAAMDFEGVFSPVYLINGIGQIFSRAGEGLIAFNFTLRGTPDSPEVGVNPLSALTPGGFRDLFRRPRPAP